MIRDVHGPGRDLHHLSVTGVLVSAFLVTAAARAQVDPDEDRDDEAAEVARFEIPEEVFDSWAFRHGQTPETTRAKLKQQLAIHLDDIDRAGKLTEDQRKKLKLAGEGDIKRYFDAVETVRRQFLAVRKDRDKHNGIWKQIHPLQSRLEAGIFGDGSILRKSLRQVLTAEHASLYEQNERDRRVFRQRAEIEWVVTMLDNVMPLGEEQRQKLIDLLVAETKLPRSSGDVDHYLILWQLSRLPDDKLKPWLDETQWKVLEQQFHHMRGIDEHLRKSGKLVFEGDPDSADDEETAPPATKDGSRS